MSEGSVAGDNLVIVVNTRFWKLHFGGFLARLENISTSGSKQRKRNRTRWTLRPGRKDGRGLQTGSQYRASVQFIFLRYAGSCRGVFAGQGWPELLLLQHQ
jgi:hypothetical protein